MRKSHLILTAFAVSTIAGLGFASAADLPVKALPPVVPVYNWTGCYIGANGGWKQAKFRDESVTIPAVNTTILTTPIVTTTDVVPIGDVSKSSGAFGGQLGCRWEGPSHWVFGVEGDADWTRNHGSVTVLDPRFGTTRTLTLTNYDTWEARARWQASVRGIVGYAWDKWLLYATGGVAFTEIRQAGTFVAGNLSTSTVLLIPGASVGDSQVLTGGTIGAGLAYAINRNWDIGAEYRYTRYQGQDFGLGSLPLACVTTTICANATLNGHAALSTNEVLFKLNYKFYDWPVAGVVAKY